MPYTGELIAIATVLCWTLSVQFFEAASRRVGAVPVNIIRIAVALALFSGLIFYREGILFPTGFPARAWLYLGLSGVVGFFLGDICLFNALVALGPRLALLIFSLSAPMAALLGWAFLSETYAPVQWMGMLVTLTGVMMVILERNRGPLPGPERQADLRGVLFGIGAMLGQAGGYVMSKTGMQTAGGYLDAFSATQIRAIAAFACFVLYFTLSGKWAQVGSALKDRRAVALTATGSVLGPFIGVSLSLLTLHYLTAGVASTFLSMTPVCIIPFAIYIHKERVSPRAIMGALTAVGGIWLLSAT